MERERTWTWGEQATSSVDNSSYCVVGSSSPREVGHESEFVQACGASNDLVGHLKVVYDLFDVYPG